MSRKQLLQSTCSLSVDAGIWYKEPSGVWEEERLTKANKKIAEWARTFMLHISESLMDSLKYI